MRTLMSIVFVLLLGMTRASAASAIFLPFPAPPHSAISNLAFAPDGTAFFLNHADEVDSVSPSGRYTKIVVAHARAAPGNQGATSIIYAHDNLWMLADYGIVKAAPDGSRHRLYVLQVPGLPTYAEALTIGNDGAIYALAQYDTSRGVGTNLYRIDSRGVVTSIPLPFLNDGFANEFVAGESGDFYISYTSDAGLGLQDGIARIRFDGTARTMLLPNNERAFSIAFSHAALYFVTLDSAIGYTYSLDRLTESNVLSSIPFPAPPPYQFPGTLSVDDGGNLWVSVGQLSSDTSALLYLYNIRTGRFSAPFNSGQSDFIYQGLLYIGPDDNLWYPTTDVANDDLTDGLTVVTFKGSNLQRFRKARATRPFSFGHTR